MKTIVHLSDLHFNTIDPGLLEPAAEAISSVAPDLLAVSGDLTQHARREEFEAAMAFIRRLPGRLIVGPGNHDMAFLNIWRRATQRLKLFRELVTNAPEPFWCDSEIAILGLNTARVTHLRDGRIRSWQVRRMEERMAEAEPNAVRVLVTHHPFDLPIDFHQRELIGGGREYLPRVVKCVDVMLAGHMHISFAGPTAVRFKMQGNSAIFVQAGTALSTRRRTECNSFQVIRTTPGSIQTEQWLEADGGFRPQQRHTFEKKGQEWVPVSPATPAVEV